MKWLHIIGFLLVIIGALNWGIIGLFQFNLVNVIFGAWPWLERVIYIVVGLSGLYIIFTHNADCKSCMMMMKGKKK